MATAISMPEDGPKIFAEPSPVWTLEPMTTLEVLKSLHYGDKSIISFWKQDDTGQVSINLGGIKVSELDEIFPTLSAFMQGDFYFSVNSTYDQKYARISDLTGLKTYRRIEKQLQWINCIAVDLDVNHDDAPAIPFHSLIETFSRELEDANLPPPSLLSSSGRGAWALWPLHDQNYPDSPPPAFHNVQRIVKRISKAIVKQFSHFASDKLCTDCARLIRVPGSLNTTSGRTVQFFRVSDQTYTLRDLSDAFGVYGQKTELEPVRTEKEEAKREKNENRVLAGKLRWAIPLEGFRQLWKMRSTFSKGTRRCAVYSLSYLLRKNRVSEDRILLECTRLSESFENPISDAEVMQCVTESAKNLQRLSNLWFADALKITTAEKLQLPRWFKPYKRTKKAQVSQRQRFIKEIIAIVPEITVRDLAEVLKEKHGISVGKSSIARDLKQVKTFLSQNRY